ncbi:MAG: patatin-like phospholipase family protein [Bacteroidales bacterium]|nr:patatin-like phospholipase family protein [Bacteroidales bacterium]
MNRITFRKSRLYRRLVLLLLHQVLLLSMLSAQSVGLVMSGGGARGCFHIGVIKALEENHVPIDYVAGTSMGAIIAGLYAIGYSPDEMLALILSEDFVSWQTGKVDERDLSSYKREESITNVLQLKFSRIDSATVSLSPVHLINPIQMNFAFMQLFAPSAAVCEGDFNRLMVPFRCVSSDIYEKKAVVLRGGDLGSAIRTSMTFPFVFKPISIDGRILYDGGMYNNFPVDVMKQDFNPDFIVGSVVSHNTTQEMSATSTFEQFSAMMMQNTDYSVDPADGISIDVEMPDVNLLDFHKAAQLSEYGYRKTMERMDEIKRRVSREMPADSLAARRAAYTARLPKLMFHSFSVSGISDDQRRYFQREFKKILAEHSDRLISLEEARQLYFSILSDPTVAEIIPAAQYAPGDSTYRLIFDMKLTSGMSLMAGLAINSASSGHTYLGAGYTRLSDFKQSYLVDVVIGQHYNMLHGDVRLDFSSRIPFYLRATGVASDIHFYRRDGILEHTASREQLYQRERYLKFGIGTPWGKTRLELLGGTGLLTDDYYQSDLVGAFCDWERSQFQLGVLTLGADRSTLNMHPYATRGFRFSGYLQYVGGHEKYLPGKVKDDYRNMDGEIFGSGVSLHAYSRAPRHWYQAAVKYEQFMPAGSRFCLGMLFQGVISTMPLMENYMSTVITAPAFRPTLHSRTVFNEAYSAQRYAAVGAMPLWHLRKNLMLRTDLYAFMPYRRYTKNLSVASADGVGLAYRAGYGKALSTLAYISETSLIFNLEGFQFSLYVNYYSRGYPQWNFGINIGYLLQNHLHFLTD